MYTHVFLLSADIEKKGSDFVLAEADAGGILLAEWRLKACKKLIDGGMAQKIVIVGYYDESFSEVSRSTEILTMLIREYGIDPSRLESVTQNEPGTHGNVQQIVAYVAENKIPLSECAVLSNFYHLPRVMQLFAKYSDMPIKPLAAESFFLDESTEIAKEYSSEAFSKRLISELSGLGS